jgi:hypothetical protein
VSRTVGPVEAVRPCRPITTPQSATGVIRGFGGGSIIVALERELETFRKELPGLLLVEGNRGKFALVHGDRVDSAWATVDEALAAGYDRFGLEPFLVKLITEHEQPRYFSRNVPPCRS